MWWASALILAGAVMVVATRNLFRAALSLGVVLVGVAIMFVLLEAEFLACVQVLVYVGAILTLVVFAITLTPPRTPARRELLPAARAAGRAGVGRQYGPAALASGALFFFLAKMIGSAPWPEPIRRDAVSLPQLGQELVTTLILPFEVISLVFVASIVGAIAMAKGKASP